MLAQRIGHDKRKGHDRQIEQQKQDLRPRAADPADPELGPSDRREQQQKTEIIDNAECRIEIDQQWRDQSERDPAGTNRQNEALALVP